MPLFFLREGELKVSGSQSGSTPALRSAVPLGDPNHGQQKDQEHQPHVVKPSQTQIETVPSLLA